MPGDDAFADLPVSDRLVVPAGALTWRFSRSSGPGGQGVNTADSRVELSVSPLELPGSATCSGSGWRSGSVDRLVDGVLTITASEHRQQLRNREAGPGPDVRGPAGGDRGPTEDPAEDQAVPRVAGAADQGQEGARGD